MSRRPISILDDIPATRQLRRDQRKRITETIALNREEPLLALQSVRNYIAGCSARDQVSQVRFTDQYRGLLLDSASDPVFISVFTHNFSDVSAEKLGTAYHYRIIPEPVYEAPVLN